MTSFRTLHTVHNFAKNLCKLWTCLFPSLSPTLPKTSAVSRLARSVNQLSSAKCLKICNCLHRFKIAREPFEIEWIISTFAIYLPIHYEI